MLGRRCDTRRARSGPARRGRSDVIGRRPVRLELPNLRRQTSVERGARNRVERGLNRGRGMQPNAAWDGRYAPLQSMHGSDRRRGVQQAFSAIDALSRNKRRNGAPVGFAVRANHCCRRAQRSACRRRSRSSVSLHVQGYTGHWQGSCLASKSRSPWACLAQSTKHAKSASVACYRNELPRVNGCMRCDAMRLGKCWHSGRSGARNMSDELWATFVAL